MDAGHVFDAGWKARVPSSWRLYADGSFAPPNPETCFDVAWATRLPAAPSVVEPIADETRLLTAEEYAERHGPGASYAAYLEQHAQWGHPDDAHVEAWRAQLKKPERPFRFEDLNGAPEPEHWGPVYPKTAPAAVEKWRRVSAARALSEDEARAYGAAVHAWISGLNAVKPSQGLATRSNCASGQAGDFSANKHRNTLRAALFAAIAAERRAFAADRRKQEAAYQAAMAEKRARLEREARQGAGIVEPKPVEPANVNRKRKRKAA